MQVVKIDDERRGSRRRSTKKKLINSSQSDARLKKLVEGLGFNSEDLKQDDVQYLKEFIIRLILADQADTNPNLTNNY